MVTVRGVPGVITPETSGVRATLMLPAFAPGSMPIVYVPVMVSVTEPMKVVPLVQLEEVSCAPPGAKIYNVQPANVEPLSCRLAPCPATPSNSSRPILLAASVTV